MPTSGKVQTAQPCGVKRVENRSLAAGVKIVDLPHGIPARNYPPKPPLFRKFCPRRRANRRVPFPSTTQRGLFFLNRSRGLTRWSVALAGSLRRLPVRLRPNFAASPMRLNKQEPQTALECPLTKLCGFRCSRRCWPRTCPEVRFEVCYFFLAEGSEQSGGAGLAGGQGVFPTAAPIATASTATAVRTSNNIRKTPWARLPSGALDILVWLRQSSRRAHDFPARPRLVGVNFRGIFA